MHSTAYASDSLSIWLMSQMFRPSLHHTHTHSSSTPECDCEMMNLLVLLFKGWQALSCFSEHKIVQCVGRGNQSNGELPSCCCHIHTTLHKTTKACLQQLKKDSQGCHCFLVFQQKTFCYFRHFQYLHPLITDDIAAHRFKVAFPSKQQQSLILADSKYVSQTVTRFLLSQLPN